MRVVHYGFESNHMHLIVEAENWLSLSKGMGGLETRMARGLNKLWQRRGEVFPDRYHSRILRTPREVRNAIAYVLRNSAHHGIEIIGPDPFSSGRWFDGWKEAERKPSSRTRELVQHLVRPTTWLLNVGWKRWGLISAFEVPGGRD